MELSPGLGSNDVHHAEPENNTDGDAARLDSVSAATPFTSFFSLQHQ
jgi:hypothetical protein